MSNVKEYKRQSLILLDGLLMPHRVFRSNKFREGITYKPQSGDIFIASYPKSGTTWTQYIVWEIMNDAAQPPYVNEIWFTHTAQIEFVGAKSLHSIIGKPLR